MRSRQKPDGMFVLPSAERARWEPGASIVRQRVPASLALSVQRAQIRQMVLASVLPAVVVFLLAGFLMDLPPWAEGDPRRDALFFGSLLCAAGLAALIALLVGLRRHPTVLAIWWVAEVVDRDWVALDGRSAPQTVEEGMRRLGGRDDDLAVQLRAGLLAAKGSFGDADALVGEWRPGSPEAVAARDRRALALTSDDATKPFAVAWASASALDDAALVRAAQARVLTADAQRRADLGQDPSARLGQACALLGPLVHDLMPARRAQRDWRYRRWLAARVAVTVVPLIAAVLVITGALPR